MALGGALGLAWSPDARDAAALCVAGVAQTHIYLVLRGRRGTNSHPPSFCVAGVALMALGGALGLAWAPVTPRHFAWQAWHKLTSTFVSRGRRGTNSHLPSFHVAGVALMALGGALGLAWAPVTPRHFAWQAWHNLTSTFVSRGRRGTNSHPPSFHVAGVALMALALMWRAWTGLVARDARDAAALCVAGVAQTHIHLRFAWQAWHKLTSTVVLRGRRGTHGTGWRAWTGLGACDAAALCVAGVAQTHTYLSFHVAGVAQTHIHRRFAWQAWHNNSHPPSFCVAGVAQPHIHHRFTWQAWHSWHWVARLDWLGRP